MSGVLPTAAAPPATVTAPPLTRSLPAASRLTVMLLLRLSPNTLSVPLLNVAVTAALALMAVPAGAATPRTALVISRRARRRRAWGRRGCIRVAFGGGGGGR